MYWFRYLLLVFAVLSSSAWAADHGKSSHRIDNIPLPLTKNTAAELTRIRSGGKILSVEQRRNGNHVVFRVKVLHNDGKVKIYHIDRDTGRNK